MWLNTNNNWQIAKRFIGECGIGYNRGMYIDSHCHINFPELAARMPDILAQMEHNKVTHALCVSVDLPDFPQVLALAHQYPHIYASVGVHPD